MIVRVSFSQQDMSKNIQLNMIEHAFFTNYKIHCLDTFVKAFLAIENIHQGLLWPSLLGGCTNLRRLRALWRFKLIFAGLSWCLKICARQNVAIKWLLSVAHWKVSSITEPCEKRRTRCWSDWGTGVKCRGYWCTQGSVKVWRFGCWL